MKKYRENITGTISLITFLISCLRFDGVLSLTIFCFIRGDDLVKYADPTSSVLSAIIILVASQGLVRSCVWIVMESVPQGMDIPEVKVQILDLAGVVGTLVHFLIMFDYGCSYVIVDSV